MRYIKNHKYCIEELAKLHYGTTEVISFGGYLLEDGTILNFSYEGWQRDEDHRNIGQFFRTSQGTQAMLKFMRRGNVRIMGSRDGYNFEYIKPLTREQEYVIKTAYKDARKLGLEFMIEEDDKNGMPQRCFYDIEDYEFRNYKEA